MHNQSVDVHLTKEHVCDVQPSALGCEECLKTGARWVQAAISANPTAVTTIRRPAGVLLTAVDTRCGT
mgnify:CR=1 FL=1